MQLKMQTTFEEDSLNFLPNSTFQHLQQIIIGKLQSVAVSYWGSSLLCSLVQKALWMFSTITALKYLPSLCSLLLKLMGTSA